MDSLFDCFPAVEGIHAAEHGILRNEYHGGLFEGRQCLRILPNVDFLEAHVRQLKLATKLRWNQISATASRTIIIYFLLGSVSVGIASTKAGLKMQYLPLTPLGLHI